MEEFFNVIGHAIRNLINEDFVLAELKIKRVENNVGFQGAYYTPKKERKSLEIWDIEIDPDLIHELYFSTQNHELNHKDWNRAVFTLHADNKFNIEYIWDQELHDEIERLNG